MFNKTKLKFDDIFEGRLPDEEVKEYLEELYQKGETAEEIAAAASAMRDHMVPLPIHYDLKDSLIDNCGTGGDKSNSFNISTTSSILLSSCGSNVAKHGNKSITSKSGSFDMLEALGVNLNLSIKSLATMLEDTGFCFMFAQKHHPGMKNIMSVRKAIEHRTIFNILGPLCNPASVKKQLIGVFSDAYIHKMITALTLLDTKRAMVVSSKDGMDEISICDVTYSTFLEEGRTRDYVIDPEKLGFKLAKKEMILGADAKTNAKITRDILENRLQGPMLDVVLLNCAAALIVDSKARDFKEGIEIARDAIQSLKASAKLKQLIDTSNKLD